MKTRLFGVITGPDFQAAEALVAESHPWIDGVEVRLDYFDAFDLQELEEFLKKISLPVMLTLRRKDQGGCFSGEEERRLELLESFCSFKPDYIDLEYDVPLSFREKLFKAYPKIRFLSSYHDFSGTPNNLEEVYKKVKTPHAHLCKIAVMATSSIDALRFCRFAKEMCKEGSFIAISMGEEGKAVRILAPVIGSCIAYATLSHQKTTAEGQMTARELQEIYRFRKLNPQTQIYCLIGDPVDKSLGAIVHNAVFKNFDLSAVYIKMRVKKEEVSDFFSFLPSLPFKGISVTMPLKELVLPFLTDLSPEVKRLQACNTIKLEGSQSYGFNTDGIGALNAIEQTGSVAHKKIVLFGAGGAAKPIALEAIQRGASVIILNRTASKAIHLAEILNCRGGGWDLIPEIAQEDYDICINTTSDPDAVPEEGILPGKIAMDIVYVPKNTPFLVKASRKHCHIVFGSEMFIYQALEQDLIWLSDKIVSDRAFLIIKQCMLN